MKKQIVSSALALSMVFGGAAYLPEGFSAQNSIVAQAEDILTYGDFEYTYNDDRTVKITKYTGDSADVTIPSSINGKNVTSISSAFIGCYGITSVTIPDGVTSIGDNTFLFCGDLTSVTIPKSVTFIGCDAFAYTKWLENKQNEDPIVVVNDILIDCEKCSGDVTIPNNVKCINSSSFSKCTDITSITIPDSVTEINNGAFMSCTGLTSISIPNSVISVGNGLFIDCRSLKSVTIPNSFTEIGYSDFAFCESLTSIALPDSIISINDEAFNGCTSLTDITLPDSVSYIGCGAFRNCTSLTSITIPANVSYIDECAFDGITSSVKIFCYYGSYAEQYAIKNGIKYKLFDEPEEAPEEEEKFEYPAYGDDSDSDTDSDHAHNYTSKITKAATCKSTGVRTYTCSCGDTYTKTIAKTAHKYTTKVVAPTYNAQGYTQHTCSVCGDSYKDTYTAKLTRTSIAKATVTGISNKVYTGKAIKPSPAVKLGNRTLKKGTDYTLSYKNNVKCGKATVTVTGKGNYTGKVTKTFIIKPKKAAVKKLSSPKTRQLKVAIKQSAGGVTGYQITYSTSKKFTKKTTKSVRITSTSRTIKNLKKGKTYYVKVRAYKKTGGVRYFSSYSAVKKLRIK